MERPDTLTPIVEAALFFALVGILVFGGVWVWLYKTLHRHMAVAHPHHGERRNGMDELFAKVMFLVGGQDKHLADAKVSRLCLGLRICSVLLGLCFVVMVFGPMALGRH